MTWAGSVPASKPLARSDRQVRQCLVGLDERDDAGSHTQPITKVGEPDNERPPRGSGEDQTHRILAVADAQRVNLTKRGLVGDRGRTSSMWAPRILGSPGPR